MEDAFKAQAKNDDRVKERPSLTDIAPAERAYLVETMWLISIAQLAPGHEAKLMASFNVLKGVLPQCDLSQGQCNLVALTKTANKLYNLAETESLTWGQILTWADEFLSNNGRRIVSDLRKKATKEELEKLISKGDSIPAPMVKQAPPAPLNKEPAQQQQAPGKPIEERMFLLAESKVTTPAPGPSVVGKEPEQKRPRTLADDTEEVPADHPLADLFARINALKK